MAEAKWYVAHTYSGYENKVKADLEKTIENRHLEDEILEVRVPSCGDEKRCEKDRSKEAVSGIRSCKYDYE